MLKIWATSKIFIASLMTKRFPRNNSNSRTSAKFSARTNISQSPRNTKKRNFGMPSVNPPKRKSPIRNKTTETTKKIMDVRSMNKNQEERTANVNQESTSKDVNLNQNKISVSSDDDVNLNLTYLMKCPKCVLITVCHNTCMQPPFSI